VEWLAGGVDKEACSKTYYFFSFFSSVLFFYYYSVFALFTSQCCTTGITPYIDLTYYIDPTLLLFLEAHEIMYMTY